MLTMTVERQPCAYELPKIGKDMKLCEAYRDIPLACEAGKVYHGFLRTHLIPEYWSFWSQAQYGGVRHRSCDFGNLAGRSFMQVAKARVGLVLLCFLMRSRLLRLCSGLLCVISVLVITRRLKH